MKIRRGFGLALATIVKPSRVKGEYLKAMNRLLKNLKLKI